MQALHQSMSMSSWVANWTSSNFVSHEYNDRLFIQWPYVRTRIPKAIRGKELSETWINIRTINKHNFGLASAAVRVFDRKWHGPWIWTRSKLDAFRIEIPRQMRFLLVTWQVFGLFGPRAVVSPCQSQGKGVPGLICACIWDRAISSLLAWGRLHSLTLTKTAGMNRIRNLLEDSLL